MKVILINGSSHEKGNTAFALDKAEAVLADQGIGAERINIGREALHGCIGCGVCAKQQNRQCRFTDDPVNGWLKHMLDADGMIIGTPVYYAGMNGALKSFLDRAFFVAAANGGLFRHKVGMALAAVRRAGALPAFDQINKYFTISEMFVASGNYWNMVYGMLPGEAAGDAEGVQCVELSAANMAWMLKLMEHGKGAVPPPAAPPKARTNFIR